MIQLGNALPDREGVRSTAIDVISIRSDVIYVCYKINDSKERVIAISRLLVGYIITENQISPKYRTDGEMSSYQT